MFPVVGGIVDLALTLALDVWKERLRKRDQVEVGFHFQKLSGQMRVDQTLCMYDRQKTSCFSIILTLLSGP